MPPKHTSSLLSVRAYRRARGISDTTFWRERRAGLWNPVNISGRLYITVDEIAAFERKALQGALARKLPVPGQHTEA